MKLSLPIDPHLFWILEPMPSREELLKELARRIGDAIEEIDTEALEAALLRREKQGPTSTPEAVAFPHAMLEGIKESYLAAAVVKGGVPFNPAHPPCDLIFLLIGPPDAAWEHIRTLARLARICRASGALQRIRASMSGPELSAQLMKEDDRIGG